MKFFLHVFCPSIVTVIARLLATSYKKLFRKFEMSKIFNGFNILVFWSHKRYDLCQK